MEKNFYFENIIAWQKAHAFVLQVYTLTKRYSFSGFSIPMRKASRTTESKTNAPFHSPLNPLNPSTPL